MEKEAATPSPGCSQCQRLQAQLQEVRAQLDAQSAHMEQMQATVALLEEQLAAARKDSSTSSKPPSSDIVKPPPPPPPPGQDKRKRGGQPGHPKHDRAVFPIEQVTHPYAHTLDCCPCCGGLLHLNGTLQRVIQQVDARPPQLIIEQHTFPEYWCVNCERAFKKPPPEHIAKGGLVGPWLTTLIAFLKGFCHASYSTIRKFIRDVVQVTICRSQLKNIIAKVSDALDEPYQELLDALPEQKILNVDETGHKDNGDQMWAWCFRASLFCLFKIDPTRSADVLINVLGKEYGGVVGCDCWSAYRRYMRECGVTLQFCLAHLIRDVKFLTKLPDKRDQAHGERLLEALRKLFGVIHRREKVSAAVFKQDLEAARDELLRQGIQNAPPTENSQRLAKRFAQHGASYFTFITTPGVQPTNNLAEQAIRFVVIDRHITQGTRSEGGQRWCERIWTVIATCTQQNDRSVFDFLYAAVKAYFGGGVVPSLLPTG